jgi:MSHA pilin protein MshD
MRGRGFTFIELIMFIAIVGVGLAGVMVALNTSAAKSADPLIIKQTLAVAEGFMEEITLKAYSNPTGGFTATPPAVETNRSQFDDVTDYHGYDQMGVYSAAGTPLTGLESYRVQISIGTGSTPTTLGSPSTIGSPSANVWLIQVTVTGPGGYSAVLSGYRSDY